MAFEIELTGAKEGGDQPLAKAFAKIENLFSIMHAQHVLSYQLYFKETKNKDFNLML